MMARATVTTLAMFLVVGDLLAVDKSQLGSIQGVIRSAIGVSRKGTEIPCYLTQTDLDYHTSKRRILLIGGMDGQTNSVQAVKEASRWFWTSSEAKAWRENYAISCIPCVLIDANQGKPLTGFPPRGSAYNSKTDPEAAYLWRWIGMHAPDLVIDIRDATSASWRLPTDLPDHWRKRLDSLPKAVALDHSPDELVVALGPHKPSGTGNVPGIQCLGSFGPDELTTLFKALDRAESLPISAARKTIQSRLARSPEQVAEQLAEVYGHRMGSVSYIPALALLGRVELGQLQGNDKPLASVQEILNPYINGTRESLGKRANGSVVAGHLVFGHLAKLTGDKAHLAIARQAAEVGFDAAGNPLAAMPAHNEMSDAVFMGCAILAQVGRLTGDEKYYQLCLDHLHFMQKLDLREDGLYRHSPLDEAAWGRGNGFPALGLALVLSELPEDHPSREPILKSFQAHMAALVRHQDPTGAWHQVIDKPGSYRELTSTCMIGFAISRGIQRGWLDRKKFAPHGEKAWNAAKTRIADDGSLVDVCTGTGKQRSLRDYYDRTAILGRDNRGGAMALLFAIERMRYKSDD